MWAMWCHGLRGRGTQGQEEQRRKERVPSSREEETLRNDQRTTLQCRSDQERQAKDSTSERNHRNTIHTISSDTQKRAAVYSDVVYSDANHLAPRSKKPRIVGALFQPTFPSNEHSHTGTDGDSLFREHIMVDSSSKLPTQTSSLPATLLKSSVENGAFQAANERLEQGFDPPLSCQPCSKEGAAADARIQKLEQELHTLEEELKNQNQDEIMDVDAVHNSTREATASPNGTYRARRTTIV
jgi:hypothetical protein